LAGLKSTHKLEGMTKEELAYLSVSCPLCKATKGHYCTMPKGAPYYRRADGKKRRAFHSMRKKRAFALYQIHATALEMDRHENRELANKHPQVQRATTTADGCKVIDVDFTTRRKQGA
jgi:hypothetical protein